MTFEGLITAVAKEMRVNKVTAEAFIRSYMKVITSALVNKDNVVLPGMFRVSNTKQAERNIFNKTTKKKVIVPEKRRLKITTFDRLKEAING